MMQKVARFFFEKLLRWHITTDYPAVEKSIIVVAPHTSMWDAILGKLVLLSYGLKHKMLSKESLFVFPLSIFMRWFGSIPVKKHDRRSLYQLVDLLEASKTMHLVICPEGTRRAVHNWNLGFCLIARMTNVPVYAVYIDYKKKEIGVKGEVITEKSQALINLRHFFQHVTAKYPSRFLLPE